MIEILFLICLPFDYSNCSWDLEFFPVSELPKNDWHYEFIMDSQEGNKIRIPDNYRDMDFLAQHDGYPTMWNYIFHRLQSNLGVENNE